MCKDLLCIWLLISSFSLYSGSSIDFTASFHFIKDSDIVSSGSFILGFFSPGSSTNRYVGIWYLSTTTVIWVANRNNPLRDSSGVFTISKDGNLVVLNGQNLPLWSSNVSNIPPNSSIMAQLLDTGNLVLKENTTGNTLWCSFRHPSDSFFPKMILSKNRGTDEKQMLTSWKSPSDPSIGSFSACIDRSDAPEVVVYNGTKPYWRSGPWDGRKFLGVMASSYLDGFDLREYNGTYSFSYYFSNPSYFAVFKLNSTGKVVVTVWSNKKEIRRLIIPEKECDVYGKCGEFGFCNPQSTPICNCLDGFEPKNPEWNEQSWKNGCIRKKPLQCEKRKENESEDGFKKLENMKTPDFVEKLQVPAENCRWQCLQNCSCLAYAYDDSIGCMSWSGKLIDITTTFPSRGVDLYIRLANSELEKQAAERRNKRKVIVIAISVIIGAIFFAACLHFLWIVVARSKGKKNQRSLSERMVRESRQEKLEELPLFEFENLSIATNNFDQSNLLGHGGFGPVYKGQLQDSQVIAVKRLSRGSRQGLEEFMNEVKVISKLQHRNLVRLLGCCIEGDEKMLIYEYMTNKSLDALLFEKSDIFSFGVLLLEIVTGKKNTRFYHQEMSLTLLGFAWKLWIEDNIKSLIDP